MVYLRMGPTPWPRTSHPAAVSMGEPQLPIWTNSQGNRGLMTSSREYQKFSASEYIRWMFSPSCLESMT